MIKHFIRCVTLVAFSFAPLLPSTARADDCLDVLTHKVYDITDYQEISFAYLDRESTSNEKTHQDETAGVGVVIDDIPFTVNDRKNADTQISNNQHFHFESQDRIHVLTYSGQANIITAWSDCMSQRGGIQLRFEGVDSLFTNKLVLHIKYFVATSDGVIRPQPNLHLGAAVQFPPNVTVQDSAGCLALSNPKIYKAGETICDVQIQTQSQWDSFPITFPFVDDSNNPKSATVFVPMRAKLRAAQQAWPSKATDISLYAFANDSASEPNAHNHQRVPADLSGYFIQDSIVKKLAGRTNTGRCAIDSRIDPSGGAAVLEVDVTQSDGPGEVCEGFFHGTQVQMYWQPPVLR
jgi:hypothetical protein